MNRVCSVCGVIMVGFVTFAGCRQAECPQRPPAVDDGGAPDAPPVEPEGLERACGNACAQLAQLGCPEANPNPGGESCYTICAKAETSRKFTLKPACLAAAKTVPAVRACGTVRCASVSAP